MTRVKFQFFGRNHLAGRDVAAFENGEVRTLNTSPDGIHLIKIIATEDNSVILDNIGEQPFDFTVSGFMNNDLHVYARCEYEPSSQSIKVNGNWRIHKEGPTNKMIGQHGTYVVSPFLNIRFHSSNFDNNRLSRLDVTINDHETTSMFFTPTELLFLTLEGDEIDVNINRLTSRMVAFGFETNN